MTSSQTAIVVGLDGSDESRSALTWAVENSNTNETIHIVHAFSPIAELAIAAVQQDWGPHRDRLTRALEQEWVAEARSSGAALYTSVVDDDPVDAILSKALTVDARMIVVGRHGSGFSRTLGSVARGLLHALPVPVVVAVDESARSESSTSGAVLACLGYGRAARSVQSWASDFAGSHHRSLDLLHVVGFRPFVPLDSPSDMLGSYLGAETALEWANAELQDRSDEIAADHPALSVNCRVGRGSVVKRVIEYGADASLIVLGEGHTEVITRNMFASRTLSIINGADVAVAVVPA
jgi:nucleotide-binding universal stress UspA family protein